MTAQADATTQVPADPPPPADRGPGATLQVLRVVAVLHSLSFLAQPVFAGGYPDQASANASSRYRR